MNQLLAAEQSRADWNTGHESDPEICNSLTLTKSKQNILGHFRAFRAATECQDTNIKALLSYIQAMNSIVEKVLVN